MPIILDSRGYPINTDHHSNCADCEGCTAEAVWLRQRLEALEEIVFGKPQEEILVFP